MGGWGNMLRAAIISLGTLVADLAYSKPCLIRNKLPVPSISDNRDSTVHVNCLTMFIINMGIDTKTGDSVSLYYTCVVRKYVMVILFRIQATSCDK